MTEKWGPSVWNLFHTLVEKIKEEDYERLGKELFSFIFRVCSVLPCPECSQHAKKFLSGINPKTLKTKDNLKSTMYIFHNFVNKRKHKEIFNFENMDKYKNNNIIEVFNQFVKVYNTKGNMNLLTDSFQRQMVVRDFKKWLTINMSSFV
jgi:uncharacterized membrane protein YheB (UPF0754 family)